MTKKAMGDTHNFNRRVSSFKADGQFFVNKPRTMYWEYLFLDRSSPFRKCLRELDSNLDFDQIFGNIRITTSDSYETGVADYVEDSPIADLDKWLVAYGELLGVAIIFGITDLHRENVYNVNNRPNILDLECIFWGAELPSETFLLPKDSFEWSKSIWTATSFLGLRTLDPEQVLWVLKGYTNVLNCIQSHSKTLLSALTSLNLSGRPIRFLIERTRDYVQRSKIGEDDKKEFLAEEIIQMQRGDVPYFLGFSGKKDLYYYKEFSELALLSSRKPIVEEKLSRAFQTPESLLDVSRLVRLKKQGIVEIVVRLLSPKRIPYDGMGVRFFIEENFLKIVMDEVSLKVKYQGKIGD